MDSDIRETTTPADHVGIIKYCVDKFVRCHPSLESHRDDMISDGYIAMLKWWDSYDPEKAPFAVYARIKMRRVCGTYLLKSARPVALPHCNERALTETRIVYIDKFDSQLDIPDGKQTAEEQMINDEHRKFLVRALRSLSMKERTLVIEYYGLFGGEPRSLKDLSQKYGISREGVRYRVNKATHKLSDSAHRLRFNEKYGVSYGK